MIVAVMKSNSKPAEDKKIRPDYNHDHMHEEEKDQSKKSGNIDNSKIKIVKKRSLLSNYDYEIELKVVYDHAKFLIFYQAYGSSKYIDELVGEGSDYINDVTNIYESTSWTGSIQSISVILVEVEIITSWTGIYASLKPVAWNADYCQGCDDIYSCPIADYNYNGLFQDWVNANELSNKDTSSIYIYFFFWI